MKNLIFTFIALFLCFLVFAFFKSRGGQSKSIENWPFYAKSLMTQPEQVLYHRLVASLPEQLVLAQVQVSCILRVKKGFKALEWRNRINRMSYDFVVCAKDTSVQAVIELDDSTHNTPRRIEQDKKKDKATKDAGVRMIRWNVAAIPDEAAIKAAFAIGAPKLAVVAPPQASFKVAPSAAAQSARMPQKTKTLDLLHI